MYKESILRSGESFLPCLITLWKYIDRKFCPNREVATAKSDEPNVEKLNSAINRIIKFFVSFKILSFPFENIRYISPNCLDSSTIQTAIPIEQPAAKI